MNLSICNFELWMLFWFDSAHVSGSVLKPGPCTPDPQAARPSHRSDDHDDSKQNNDDVNLKVCCLNAVALRQLLLPVSDIFRHCHASAPSRDELASVYAIL